MFNFEDIDVASNTTVIADAPAGLDGMLLAELARHLGATGPSETPVILHVARDAERMRFLAEAISFFNPDLELATFPAWDCIPYDRVSPNSAISGERVTTLSRLASSSGGDMPQVVLTTVNAVLQRVPTRKSMERTYIQGVAGKPIDRDELIGFLGQNGYVRSGTVREPGEFAVRGGIIDIYPTGADEPYRLDLFGDQLEAVRLFDPLTQVTTQRIAEFVLRPTGEVRLDENSIGRFRNKYREMFGTVTKIDPLYESVSAGHRHIGMEHWLPLFYDGMETLFDYLPDAVLTMDGLVDEAVSSRIEMIEEQFAARRNHKSNAAGAPYNAISPDLLYLSASEWQAQTSLKAKAIFGSFGATSVKANRLEVGGNAGRNFALERTKEGTDLFGVAHEYAVAQIKKGMRVVVTCFSEGSRDRFRSLMDQHEWGQVALVSSWDEAQKLPANVTALALLPLEQGYVGAGMTVITEQDVLGDRLIRKSRWPRRNELFLTEISSLGIGDYVVHIDHGIGRFEGLQTLDVSGAPHDCVWLAYAGSDRLFVPVENIEVLSRYGSSDAVVNLDRLGGSGWQARKARLKGRIRDMADQLIKVAASRVERRAPVLVPPPGDYEKFCARFPFDLTPDQQVAIEDVVESLGAGRPADRLICGDVGFGKTEVALRAAFIAAMSGQQVAVVVPTTLLSRQHFETFRQRCEGYPIRIAQLSRMVTPKEATVVREEMAKGLIDIVIGTHALLAEKIKFKELGLVIVDEEQHFGVVHKERLKKLRSDVHVLTMTATPIPRTLQLAMTGLRDLSLIATPPVDRLAVRTFILPFDEVTLREAILREKFRGGQTFFVCPRIRDMPEVELFLKEYVPEVRFATAHGQMSAKDLDRVMQSFYDGKFDVLLSTNIVESGLDIPSANTMIIHRADRFGLAQLYQLRGRIGRSKVRAYAYLTVLPGRVPSAAAEKRLRVMETLDELGAGFSLASHDLDIRGAGNLLGEEQTGHIREVGLELYQELLEEAVAVAGRDPGENLSADKWSPQIGLGAAVLIPESYVADLDARLGLYRRVAQLETAVEINEFAAEIVDRFGPYPDEVRHLLDVVTIKGLCRKAGIEQVDAGPRGCTIKFRGDRFSNPAGLVDLIESQSGTAKLRPDHTLVFKRNWDDQDTRLSGVRLLISEIAAIATQSAAPASSTAATGSADDSSSFLKS